LDRRSFFGVQNPNCGIIAFGDPAYSTMVMVKRATSLPKSAARSKMVLPQLCEKTLRIRSCRCEIQFISIHLIDSGGGNDPRVGGRRIEWRGPGMRIRADHLKSFEIDSIACVSYDCWSLNCGPNSHTASRISADEAGEQVSCPCSVLQASESNKEATREGLSITMPTAVDMFRTRMAQSSTILVPVGWGRSGMSRWTV
jgi:hypothetical protein